MTGLDELRFARRRMDQAADEVIRAQLILRTAEQEYTQATLVYRAAMQQANA